MVTTKTYECEICDITLQGATPSKIAKHKKTKRHEKKDIQKSEYKLSNPDFKFEEGQTYCPFCKEYILNYQIGSHNKLVRHKKNKGEKVERKTKVDLSQTKEAIYMRYYRKYGEAPPPSPKKIKKEKIKAKKIKADLGPRGRAPQEVNFKPIFYGKDNKTFEYKTNKPYINERLKKFSGEFGWKNLNFMLNPTKNIKEIFKIYTNSRGLYELNTVYKPIHLLSVISDYFKKKDLRFEKINNIYYGKLKELKENIEINKHRKKRDKNKWLTYKELKKTHLSKKITNPKDRIISLLYSKVIPRRNGDYINMKISFNTLEKTLELIDSKKNNDFSNDFNYLVFYNPTRKEKKEGKEGEQYFIYNNYKTKNIYGQQVKNIKNFRIKTYVEKYIKYIKKEKISKNNDWLFKNDSGSKYSTDSWSKLVQNIFTRVWNKPISSSIARQIYATYVDLTKLTNKEIKELANSFGHSVDMFMTVYRK